MGVASFDPDYFTERLTRKLGAETWLTESEIKRGGAESGQGGAARAVKALQKAFEAQSMADHEAAMECFEEDVIWDAPPPLMGFMQSRSALRMGLYLSKALGSWELHPINAKVSAFTAVKGMHIRKLNI
jgi:hypothetical protein